MLVSAMRGRIQKSVAFFMCLVVLYLFYYSYRSFNRAWRFCYGEMERWNNSNIVEPTAVIEMSTRHMYFGLWAAAILASIAGILAGLYLLNRVRIGFFFDEISARSIQIFGLVTIFAMAVDTVFGMFDLYLLTLHNAENRYPIQYLYDPSDLKAVILASVMFMFGWVMREAVKIERENKEFV